MTIKTSASKNSFPSYINDQINLQFFTQRRAVCISQASSYWANPISPPKICSLPQHHLIFDMVSMNLSTNSGEFA